MRFDDILRLWSKPFSPSAQHSPPLLFSFYTRCHGFSPYRKQITPSCISISLHTHITLLCFSRVPFVFFFVACMDIEVILRLTNFLIPVTWLSCSGLRKKKGLRLGATHYFAWHITLCYLYLSILVAFFLFVSISGAFAKTIPYNK